MKMFKRGLSLLLAVVMVLGTMLYLAVKHRGLQKNMVAA